MKTLLFLSIVITLIFEACDSSSTEKSITAFIPGTYIRLSQHEFGSEWDTLTITLQNETAKEYNIIRRWRYDRILDGKAMQPDYKKQTTMAVYDHDAQQLKTVATGESYSFDTKQKWLFVGTTKYKKTK